MEMVSKAKCNLRRLQFTSTLENIGTYSSQLLLTFRALMLVNLENLIIYHWRCVNIIKILLQVLVFNLPFLTSFPL